MPNYQKSDFFYTYPSAHLISLFNCCLCRNRLSYEQFGAFLANVKELNSYRQTREDTLRKADEIFGPENKDLYTIFESLITRNVQ